MIKIFNIFIITISCFCFSCNNIKETKTSTETKDVAIEDQNNAKIKFENLDHDFGSIEEGEVVEYTFIFSNVGAKDLEIKKVESDCGCTATSYEKQIIKPGKQGNIKITFDSKDLFNNQLKEIKVNSNAINSEVNLMIGAYVKSERIQQ